MCHMMQIVAVDPADRLASEGVEVLAGAPLLLVHCGTQVGPSAAPSTL